MTLETSRIGGSSIAAAPATMVVSFGIIVVNVLQYTLMHDSSGHLYRFPSH